MKTPIYILPCAARAAGTSPEWLAKHGTANDMPVREWTTICRGPSFLWVRHDETRPTSRWNLVTRKRPFLVLFHRRGHTGSTDVGASATLAGAIKIAQGAA